MSAWLPSQDGPLQGYEVAANARLGAELQLNASRGVSSVRLAEAATAAAMEMSATRLKLQEPKLTEVPPDALELDMDWMPESSEDGDKEGKAEGEMENSVMYSIDRRDTPHRHAVLGSTPDRPEFAEFVASKFATAGLGGFGLVSPS